MPPPPGIPLLHRRRPSALRTQCRPPPPLQAGIRHPTSVHLLSAKMTRSYSPAPSTDTEEDSAILGLPEVPLLHILSWLPAEDVVSAGRVCRRWRWQVGCCRRLWHHQTVSCHSARKLRAVLRVAPAWDTLVLRMKDLGAELVVRFEEDARQLVVSARSPAAAARVLADEEVGRRAARLFFREVELEAAASTFLDSQDCDALWAALPGARSLETLDLVLCAAGPLALSAFRWPDNQEPLPALQNVHLELKAVRRGSEYECPALESLLRAHRDSLRCVNLYSPGLAPLLDVCSAELLRVAAPGNPGVSGHVQRFGDLEELRVEGLHPTALPEVQSLLQAPTLRGLRCLSLRSAAQCPRVLRALGELSQLTDLCLAAPVDSMNELGAALASLPRLRVLTVRPAPAAPALNSIPGSAVPALISLTVLGNPCRPRAAGAAPECRQSALRSLVMRAAGPLHVVCGECTCKPRAARAAPPRTNMLAKHKPVHDLWGCPQCVAVGEQRRLNYGEAVQQLRYLSVK